MAANPGFEIGVDRQWRRRDELADVAQRIGERHSAVGPPGRESHAGARGRQRLEAERAEIDRRADVPRIGHDEAARALVQFGEARALLSDGRRHFESSVLRLISETFCRPAVSKLPGSSQRSNASRRRGHSESEHREPGGVTITSLDDHVLPKDALEAEAVAQRSALRGRVEIIALPFVAAIAEFVEDMGGEQILRFGRADRALHRRRIKDVADLDHAMGRLDAQKSLIADRFPRGVVDDREEQRIL